MRCGVIVGRKEENARFRMCTGNLVRGDGSDVSVP
jgi:hypothetical protein